MLIHHRLAVLALLLCASFARIAYGQEDTVSVPDLLGLNVPQAATALNRMGLALGAQQFQPWTEASPIPAERISGQSLPAGQPVALGATIDVVVLQSPNTTLVYDENDLTLINQAGSALRLDNLSFQVIEGANPVSFSAMRWAGALADGNCVQIWSISRGNPKDVAGCGGIQNWFTTNSPGDHFWTGLNGAVRFAVLQDGVQRGVCEAAAAGAEPRQCQIALAAAAASSVTEYVAFAYTPGRLIIINRSADRWMPLSETVVLNSNPNLSLLELPVPVGDPTLYQRVNPVANPAQLAPGQCLLFTDGVAMTAPDLPQACDVIARLDIDASLIFWGAPFTVVSAIDQQRRTCAAAVEGRLTLCIMPR